MQSNLLNELRQSYPKAYTPWSLKEDLKLRKLYLKNTPMDNLCIKLGRQEGGIQRRLEKLGLTKSNQFKLTIYNPTKLQIVLLKIVSFLNKNNEVK